MRPAGSRVRPQYVQSISARMGNSRNSHLETPVPLDSPIRVLSPPPFFFFPPTARSRPSRPNLDDRPGEEPRTGQMRLAPIWNDGFGPVIYRCQCWMGFEKDQGRKVSIVSRAAVVSRPLDDLCCCLEWPRFKSCSPTCISRDLAGHAVCFTANKKRRSHGQDPGCSRSVRLMTSDRVRPGHGSSHLIFSATSVKSASVFHETTVVAKLVCLFHPPSSPLDTHQTTVPSDRMCCPGCPDISAA